MSIVEHGNEYTVTSERKDDLWNVVVRTKDGLFVRGWYDLEEDEAERVLQSKVFVRIRDLQTMAVLEAYEFYIGTHGKSPRLNDVQRITGYERAVVLTSISMLEAYGFVHRIPETPRGVRLLLRRVDK